MYKVNNANNYVNSFINRLMDIIRNLPPGVLNSVFLYNGQSRVKIHVIANSLCNRIIYKHVAVLQKNYLEI